MYEGPFLPMLSHVILVCCVLIFCLIGNSYGKHFKNTPFKTNSINYIYVCLMCALLLCAVAEIHEVCSRQLTRIADLHPQTEQCQAAVIYFEITKCIWEYFCFHLSLCLSSSKDTGRACSCVMDILQLWNIHENQSH